MIVRVPTQRPDSGDDGPSDREGRESDGACEALQIAAESPPLSGHISKAKCGNTRTLNLNTPILNSAALVPRLT